MRTHRTLLPYGNVRNSCGSVMFLRVLQVLLERLCSGIVRLMLI